VVEPVKVTIELGEYSSRQVRLLRLLNGGTLTSAAKAMIDLGCSVASERIDAMSLALAPEGTEDVKQYQETLLMGEDQD
jgi:hypothetical protein